MRTLGVLATLAACGCASSGGATGRAEPIAQGVSVSTGSGTSRLTVGSSGGPNTNNLEFSADQVWKILPAAFDSVKVPVNHVDPRTKTIGNNGFKLRQRLGTTPLSRFMDCGQTQIGANADSYEVHITLMVQAVPDGSGTRLVTTFEAAARPIAFSQGYSRCSSRGALESRLLEAIRAQLK